MRGALAARPRARRARRTLVPLTSARADRSRRAISSRAGRSHRRRARTRSGCSWRATKRGALSRRARGARAARARRGDRADRRALRDERSPRSAAVAAAQARPRRAALRCDRLEVLVTSPGPPGGELRASSSRARARGRRAGARPERRGGGRLGYVGALAGGRRSCRRASPSATSAAARPSSRRHAGRRAAWARSLDIGSLRLTRRSLAAIRREEGVDARAARRPRRSTASDPPLPKAALATGGSARARREASSAARSARTSSRTRVELLPREQPARKSRRAFGIAPQRARTLLAGAVILAEVQRRLGVPFDGRRHGGFREGAALELLAERACAA